MAFEGNTCCWHIYGNSMVNRSCSLIFTYICSLYVDYSISVEGQVCALLQVYCSGSYPNNSCLSTYIYSYIVCIKHTHIHTYIHTDRQTFMHTPIYVWLHIYIQIHPYINTYTNIYIHIHTCLPIYKHIYLHTTYMCECIDTYMHAYIDA